MPSVSAGWLAQFTEIGSGHDIEHPQLAKLRPKSLGYTSLIPGTVEAWQAALPDDAAQDGFHRFAVQAAAGIVASYTARPPEPYSVSEGYQIILEVAFS